MCYVQRCQIIDTLQFGNAKSLFGKIFKELIWIRTLPKSHLQIFWEILLYAQVIVISIEHPDDNS